MLRHTLAFALAAWPILGFAQEKKPDPKDAPPVPIVLVDLKRTDAVSFEKEILPIFAAKCQVCHAGNLTEGKLDLSTYASMMKGGKRGIDIVAGKDEVTIPVEVAADAKVGGITNAVVTATGTVHGKFPIAGEAKVNFTVAAPPKAVVPPPPPKK